MLSKVARVTLLRFLSSRSIPVRQFGKLASMTAEIETDSLEAVTTRDKLFKDMQIDVLSAAYATDNEKARHYVSRSFICSSVDFIFETI